MAVVGRNIRAEVEFVDLPYDPEFDDEPVAENTRGTWFASVRVNGISLCINGEPMTDPMGGCKTPGEALNLIDKWATDRRYTMKHAAVDVILWPLKTGEAP